jgi:hypothetical protein
MSLSKPCGNLKEGRNKREIKLSKIYRDADTCSYFNEDEEKTQAHSLVRETGFSESEFDVLNDNKLINYIQSKMPVSEYNKTKLMLNNYRLYAKSYSNFALKCQEDYSTYDLENSGKHIGDIGFKQSWILGVTIFVYIISIAAAFVIRDPFSAETKIVCCLAELFGYICLLVLYYSLNRSIKSVDLNLLDYVI